MQRGLDRTSFLGCGISWSDIGYHYIYHHIIASYHSPSCTPDRELAAIDGYHMITSTSSGYYSITGDINAFSFFPGSSTNTSHTLVLDQLPSSLPQLL